MKLPEALDARASSLLERMRSEEVLRRMWARDHTLWGPDPTEIADRLGWLDLPERMRPRLGGLRGLAARAAADGLDRAVLCGMGGSSLAPETFARILGPAPDGLDLVVLDTTHPDHLHAVERMLDPERTLVVASSKSGSTIETRCQLDWLREKLPGARHLLAVTDPGSPLEAFARENDFREVVGGDPDVGGRYSALSAFGLVPAALLGADLEGLLDGAAEMAAACGPDADPVDGPGARLGVVMGAAWEAGHDKLTLVLPEALRPLGPWIEQLVAESTGKRERGIVPVEGEDLGAPEAYGRDRLFVAYRPDERLDALAAAGHPVLLVDDAGAGARGLGRELFRWELATAVAGWALEINPFDQPNVQEAKEATESILASGDLGAPPFDDLEPLLDHLSPGDYLAIHAYLPRNDDLEHRLQAARMRLRDRTRVATTIGFGPRFLHSTGQLHKGGPPTGAFVQVDDEPVEDVAIPGRDFTFGTLIQAQALGDLRALRARGRRVARVRLSDLESA